MEKLYFYIEDCNGGLIVDQDYMENEFDSSYQTLLATGSKEEIEKHILWLCGYDVYDTKYYYLEDCNGGFIVDQDYMENNFDAHCEKLIFNGTMEEIEEYINWLCNNE